MILTTHPHPSPPSNLTRPAVLKDAGVVIDPLQRSRGSKKDKDSGRGVRSGGGLQAEGPKRKRAVAGPLGVKRVKAQ